MKNIFSTYLIIIIFMMSCVHHKKEINNKTIVPLIPKKNVFKNSFRIDTSLTEKSGFDFIKVTNTKKTDSVVSLCNCKKNKKNNSIKIQIVAGIPTKKALDSLRKNTNQKWNTIMHVRDLAYQKQLSGQFKFLTIVLKDSLVKSINLYAKSTDQEYNGSDFDSLTLHKYHIKISKFNYAIASDIYGEFDLRIDKGYGLFKNDTILKGSCKCNNWVIWEKDNIKNWKIDTKPKNYIE
ncbi:hypothetical protein ACG2LH_02760 [Zhouia sp. PK063]|uniref:hypothetical protein n=1 Tax=Zhouia sp. PK063 TaxID=3373602 RepID=UPI0037B48DA9